MPRVAKTRRPRWLRFVSSWGESVEEGAVRQFSSDDVLERIDEHGDLLAPLLEKGPKVST